MAGVPSRKEWEGPKGFKATDNVNWRRKLAE